MELRKHEAVASKTDMFKVNPLLLKIMPGFNVRDLEAPSAREALDELKELIRKQWVQAPIEIRKVGDDLFVTHGHRRLKVVRELIEDEGFEAKPVPAVVEPPGLSDVERKVRIHTLNAGEPLSPLEKAELVRWLLSEGGLTREQVAEKLGVKTLAMVDRYLTMSEMPEPIREAVREGEISATNAVDMVRREGPMFAEQRLEQAKEKAQEAGRKKVTAKSLPAPKPRKAAEPAPAPPRLPGAVSVLNQAMLLMIQLIDSGRTPEEAASGCLIPAQRFEKVAAWLNGVAHHIDGTDAAA